MEENIKPKTQQGSTLSEDILKTLDRFGKRSGKTSSPVDSRPCGDNQLTARGFEQMSDVMNHSITPQDDPLHATFLNSDNGDNVDGSSASSDACSLTSDSSQTSSERLNLEKEWQTLFGSDEYCDHLRQQALDGKLKYSKFRTVCWKVFLDCLPEERENWVESIQKLRHEYTMFKEQFLVDPNKHEGGAADLRVNNPLSQEDHSPWKQYFENSELKSSIKQDLDRLFPEIEYFQRTRVKEMMMHILFCHVKRNEDLGYKQGMHELLAPIVYVLDSEMKIYKYLEGDNLEVARYVMDPLYLEHDAFALFCQLMELTGQWFQHKPVGEAKNKLLDPHASLFSGEAQASPPSAIVNKLNRIQDHMLKKFDADLWIHLKTLEIAPQLYGMRWIRLLFGREFPFADVLLLWDALFADGASLVLVDYVFVAMLMAIREKLFRSNYSTCVGYLMKYPRVSEDPHLFVRRALALKGKRTSRPHSARVRPSAPLPTSARTAFSVPQKKQVTVPQKPQSVFSNLTKRLPSTHAPRTEHARPLVQQKTQTDAIDHPLSRAGGHTRPARPASVPAIDSSQDRTGSFGSRTAVGRAMKVMGLTKRQGPVRMNVDELAQDHERLQHQVSELKTEVDKIQGLYLYCGRKMDSYIGLLQEEILKEGNGDKGILYLSLAGLKQVRDLLKGTLPFRGSTMEHECDFMEIDNNIAARLQVSSPNQGTDRLPENMPVPLLANYEHFEHAAEKESSFTEYPPDEDTVQQTQTESKHFVGATAGSGTVEIQNCEKDNTEGRELENNSFDNGSASLEILKAIEESSQNILASSGDNSADFLSDESFSDSAGGRPSQEATRESDRSISEENLESFVFVNCDGSAAHVQNRSMSPRHPLKDENSDEDHFQEF